ncbi:GNAT family N-acetyltransferase [Jatrophihabitans sp. YIM 134969]
MSAARLVVPSTEYFTSFRAAQEEFRAEGRGASDDNSNVGDELRAGVASDAATFARHVTWLVGDSEEDSPRPEGRVPCTTRWWVDEQGYIGRIAIRHRLTDWLREFGGHIGYDVRASRRRQGHATAMLHAALPIARDLGIDSALITCDDTNVASRRVIENAGGVLEDQRGRKLRFWVPTT